MKKHLPIIFFLLLPCLCFGGVQPSGGTGGGGGGITSVPVGRTLYVDAINGNDGSGARGLLEKPFATIAAAVAASTSGDSIQVGPGTFDFGTTSQALSTAVEISGAGPTLTIIKCAVPSGFAKFAFHHQTTS